MAETSLSLAEARLLGLRAQHLAGPRLRDPASLLEALGAVQLDTISVLARSHLLVAWSRLGPVPGEEIEATYWPTGTATTFEYWAHAACILPIDRWPSFAFRRRARLARGRRWHRLDEPERVIAEIRRRLLAEGPLSANTLGGAKKGGPWWDWTDEKIAVEWLLDTGEVVCVRREGWRRIYDLSTRAIPTDLLDVDLDDASCLRLLVTEAARALGVASDADLAAHHGLTLAQVRSVLSDVDLIEVSVEGSKRRWYASSAWLESLSASGQRVRPTLLSPFDSLVWDRARTERLFGFVHRLEAYVPAPHRQYGYYAMPILSGRGLLGRVDPGREGRSFIAKHVSLAGTSAVAPAAAALVDAAGWVEADEIRVDRVTPAELADPLRAELAQRSVRRVPAAKGQTATPRRATPRRGAPPAPQ